eukprot:CAMPEP_0197625666 /NCGR_PEP_ID=MMETSP1338-20131121/4967_1 /TAXON_ID=43686 ORGANISM="Pelagodinium beii, Strain RCC1491" /NCGR_SAMPLE_ID=MMETSP1338 /ASSEMBLY_ACC=CAM_ASM_000754 /LENGTH=67 /DNA_ID=CAMNT_0043196123 /DNA_START=46 /DNA_END=249 /DNA_ORIENTATION=+
MAGEEALIAFVLVVGMFLAALCGDGDGGGKKYPCQCGDSWHESKGAKRKHDYRERKRAEGYSWGEIG